jgi:hypothetical protein
MQHTGRNQDGTVVALATRSCLMWTRDAHAGYPQPEKQREEQSGQQPAQHPEQQPDQGSGQGGEKGTMSL